MKTTNLLIIIGGAAVAGYFVYEKFLKKPSAPKRTGIAPRVAQPKYYPSGVDQNIQHETFKTYVLDRALSAGLFTVNPPTCQTAVQSGYMSRYNQCSFQIRATGQTLPVEQAMSYAQQVLGIPNPGQTPVGLPPAMWPLQAEYVQLTY